jgi:LacI family transcriptional regulator
MNGRAAPTIRDVAARAGVAPATVSNVLTGRRPVADGLRHVVLAAVQELGYERNHLAASLRLQRTRSVGIVVPDLTNPFFAELVRQIEEVAARSDFQILLVDSNEDPMRETARVRALLARRIDGLVMVPTTDSVACLGADGRHPPTILMDRGLDLAGFDSVGADNIEASYRGCRHLLELGHRDIALLVTVSGLVNIRDRIEGYRRALAERGCARRQRVVIGGATIEGCRAAIEPLLRGAARPTAVFAAAYVATLGAIQAIRAVDLAFPEDVSLLGFDDFDWMRVLRPYVSTMRQPVAEMASHAWTLLMSRCEKDDDKRHARIRLPCTLEVRESTRPPSLVAARRRTGRQQGEERR